DVATGPGGRMPDLLVTVTVGDQFGDMTKSTIIRDFGDDPRPNELATVAPTATHIAENAPGQASTNTVIPPATMTAEATPASQIIDTKTAVATDEPTATSTMIVEPTQTAVDPAIDVPSPAPAPVSTGLPLADPTVTFVGSALAGGDGT
ncbi:MAG TPA: hypothetical protein PK819_14625, partial [Thermomicrobiales bacterium]|nr:hypothetical protein [Thermomicrobiales bacterium]